MKNTFFKFSFALCFAFWGLSYAFAQTGIYKYSYDKLNRHTSTLSPSNDNISKTYDNAGNLVTKTVTNHCESAAFPIITGANTACAGDTITLTCTTAASHYRWSNGDTTSTTKITQSCNNVVTVTYANGCTKPSAPFAVTVKPTFTTNLTASICSGSSYLFNGINRTQSGIYRDTLIATNGCDSFLVLTLTVNLNPVAIISPISISICHGASTTLTASGGSSYVWSTTETSGTISVNPITTTIYTVTVTDTNSCSATASASITVNNSTSSSISSSICQGDSFNFYGAFLHSSGVYKDTLVNSLGCDSIVTLTLIVNQPTSSTQSQTICAGQSYVFFGTPLTAAGVYTDTLTNSHGCDSVITLTLYVNPTSSTLLNDTICAGGSFNFNGTQLTASGNYSNTLTNRFGCDSIIILSLVVNPVSSSSFSQSICQGTAFNFLGSMLYYSGDYIDTVNNVFGCDSIVTVHLTVSDSATTENRTSCNPADTGVVVLHFSNVYGCDSAHTITTTLLPSSANIVIQSNDTLYSSLGVAYQWYLNNVLMNGDTNSILLIIQNGSYKVEVTDSNGCLSIGTITVTSVGIYADSEEIGVKVYPNPNSGLFVVELNQNLFSRITIADVLGQTIRDEKVSNMKTEFNLKEVASGIYFLQLHYGIAYKTIKFIVTK